MLGLRWVSEPTLAAGGTAMPRFGTHGRVLIVDLTQGTTRIEEVEESVYRQFLGGYGFGAYLMWKHYPPGVDALAPEACFAIVSGLLTGARTPFSGRIPICAHSAPTGPSAHPHPRRLRA